MTRLLRCSPFSSARRCSLLRKSKKALDRTTTVSEQDKERTREAMNDFESLLDSGHFVRQRVAKSRAEALAEGRAEGLAEGEAKGLAEGEAKGLQEALAITVELRFPALLELAHEKAEGVKQPE